MGRYGCRIELPDTVPLRMYILQAHVSGRVVRRTCGSWDSGKHTCVQIIKGGRTARLSNEYVHAELEAAQTCLGNHLNSNRPRCSNDTLRDGFQTKRLEVGVGLLNFGNLVDVLEADGAHDVVARSAGALLYSGGLLEEIGSGRRFGGEGEGAVWLDEDLGGNGDAGLDVGSAGIELFAKVHGLDTTSTKGGTDRWRGCRLASRDKETLCACVSQIKHGVKGTKDAQ